MIIFEFENDPQLLEVHVFRATKYTGTITESEEMRPQWWAVKEIPFALMWKDDQMWFPLMLEGKPFCAYFVFRDHDTILTYSLKPTPQSEFAKTNWAAIREAAVPFADWQRAHKKTADTDEKQQTPTATASSASV